MKSKITEKILKQDLLVEKVNSQKKVTQIDLELKSLQKIYQGYIKDYETEKAHGKEKLENNLR